jgi:hypothetical protein
LTSRTRPRRTPGDQRTTAIFQRYATGLDMWASGTRPDGVETFIIQGGVVIVSKSLKYGTIRIEAEDAEISRGPAPEVDEPREPPDGKMFGDNIDFPMKIRFKGNVVVHQAQGKISGGREQRTIRAPEVEFDYVADRLIATDAKMEITAPGLLAPIKITAPRIEVFHPLERQPDGLPVPSKNREIRLDPVGKAIRD